MSTALPLPPFQWGVTPEEIASQRDEIIAATRAEWERIAALPDDGLTESTLLRPLMAQPHFKTNPLLCNTKFLQHCSPDEAVRAAAKEAGMQFSKLRVEGRMREDVYNKVKRFAASEAAKSLDEYHSHFLRAILKDFEAGGLQLARDERERLRGLLSRDAALCSQYAGNVAGDTTSLEFSEEQLEGLPESFLAARRTDSGMYTVTLKYPDMLPVLSLCQVEETRKAVSMARGSAFGNNLELMQEAVAVRKEIASALGYSSYAAYVNERRMADSVDTVWSFLNGLRERVGAAAARELAQLAELKREQKEARGEPFDGHVHAWDFRFLHKRLMDTRYGVDTERVRQYFPVDRVVSGTLELYESLFSLTFTEISDFDRWHPSVRLFAVHDEGTRQLIGHFYLDLHPREGKYTHAAIFHLLKRNGAQCAVDCMLANFPEPSDGKPALLDHDNVVTFLHEMGHIIHQMCTEGDTNSTRYAKCPRDFVEAPSQMLENWGWQESILGRLSRHHETGESLPSELLQKLIAAKNVNTALHTSRQLYLAVLDLTLHADAPPPGDLQATSDELCRSISLIPNPPGCTILRSFGHLMNQYAAGYFGYLWSEVLSADMFHSRFAVEGIENKETGMAYRKAVLAPGGVGSIARHVEKFLGRPPTDAHFLDSRGITKL
eukprot:TRINITY_DN5636_c0_g1_i1.p1 TRINITY_DN5636_c0_g1~~TRINITY_DN5636_c0_g1_i1.p1  ORF type:complete len:663 (-),score=227.36 TRINITY_DN5636_c0_g1_i1:119-2107(-)